MEEKSSMARSQVFPGFLFPHSSGMSARRATRGRDVKPAGPSLQAYS